MASRKETLVNYGFRLPSAFDNRPLLFHEFERISGVLLFQSCFFYNPDLLDIVIVHVLEPVKEIVPVIMDALMVNIQIKIV